MRAKDQLDIMAHNIADALKAFHERLERIESWMLRQEEKKPPETQVLIIDEKKKMQKKPSSL